MFNVYERAKQSQVFSESRLLFRVLAEALKDLAQRNEVINVEKTPFGMRYVIDGKINTPNQRNPFIRTVWFIEHEQTIPIFVTAYPHQE
ncbi:MAG: hypothetical protein PHD43_16565 [Methylococcales bacterium]|nr:hypothetical protein [Methylococcales bacterium]